MRFLVQQTQDPMILRLLIDLYHAHNLREDGGIARRLLRHEYGVEWVAPGSNRWGSTSTKDTVEGNRSLDINGLNRAGC